MFSGFICRSKSLQNVWKSTSKFLHNKPTTRLLSSTTSRNIVQQTIPSHSKDLQLGQAASWTHPHLLQEGDITPGITVNEYKQRREQLMVLIQNGVQFAKNHMVIIPSAITKYMTGEIPYIFRQNTDFFYYTGCLEPNSLLVIWTNEANHVRSALFMRPKDQHAELWNGPRTGVQNAVTHFGVDEAYDIKEFPAFFQKNIERERHLKIWYDQQSSSLPYVTTAITSQQVQKEYISSGTAYMHRQRVIKSSSEIQLMRKTCEIGSIAVNQTMKESKPGDSEHHIHARVDYHSRMNNANFLAYPPVVAAGNNANTIHYITNTQIVPNGEMVLMDAGCEYGGYSSDITRTWPINGSFTPAQQTLYDVILTLQKDLINTLLCDGGKTLNELFDTMCLKLGFYLQEIGLIPKSASDLELARAAYNFCPHHVSHYLGMDIHDTPSISRNLNLLPGMVFTVEPGVYINRNRRDVPEEFRGIGIRIEDDIVVNPDGNIEILTANCVKEKDQLIQLINSN